MVNVVITLLIGLPLTWKLGVLGLVLGGQMSVLGVLIAHLYWLAKRCAKAVHHEFIETANRRDSSALERRQPPVTSADSIALWTDEVMRRLAADCEIVCYSRQWKGLPNLTRYADIDYVRVPPSRLTAMSARPRASSTSAACDSRRPFFASKWCFRQFVGT